MNCETNQNEGKLRLSWEGEHYQIPPGRSHAIPLTLTNLGSDEDYYEISVTGLPSEWVAFTSECDGNPSWR